MGKKFKYSFISVCFLTVTASAIAEDALCIQKKSQLGSRFISCEVVDFGVSPISASYQPSNRGKNTQLPASANSDQPSDEQYENHYPMVAGTRVFFEGSWYADKTKKGLPLGAKLIQAVKTSNTDSEFVKYLESEWYPAQMPKTGQAGWEGQCRAWSAWSMDQELNVIFNKMNEGVVCNGVAFTKPELKELVTSLYPEPTYDQKYLRSFYQGYAGISSKIKEDANVALTKLGLLGRGDFDPSNLIHQAQEAQSSGRKMMMDKDAGAEIWNQPIKKMLDVTYSDAQVSLGEVVSTSDLVVSSMDMRARDILTKLAQIELALTTRLLMQNGISASDLCAARKLLAKDCNDLNDQMSLTAQVNALNQMKEISISENLLKIKYEKPIYAIKHDLVIEYGEEIAFGSLSPDQTKVRNYTYTSINFLDGSGHIVNPPIKSQWTPATKKMSAICKDHDYRDRVIDSLTSAIKTSVVCEELQKGASDFEVFIGATPPGDIKTFKAEPGYGLNRKKDQAYQKLLQMISQCKSFDQVIVFFQHLDQSMLTNEISQTSHQELLKEYVKIKPMVDEEWLNAYLSQKNSVKGLPELQKDLLAQ